MIWRQEEKRMDTEWEWKVRKTQLEDSEVREKRQMEGGKVSEWEIKSIIIIFIRVIQRFLSHRFILDVRLWPDLACCGLFQSLVITEEQGVRESCRISN